MAAYMLLAEKMAERPELRGEAFNFSNDVPLTVIELVDRIRRSLGSTLEPEILGQASHEIRAQYLSSAKARRLLGLDAAVFPR